MSTAISSVTGSNSTGASGSSALNTLTGADFLNLMIQQLQQQDPLNPTDSNQLLTQMSQISQLQSNTAMQTNLQGMTLQQSIGAGGNLIGKTVQGIAESGEAVTGIVTSVKVENKAVYLELDGGNELPLGSVTKIAPTTPATSNGIVEALASNSPSSSSGGVSAMLKLLSSLGAR